MASYRAIISVPIQAEDDDVAFQQATRYAHSLLHPGGGVAGHLELLTECEPSQLHPRRTVWLDSHFEKQIAVRGA